MIKIMSCKYSVVDQPLKVLQGETIRNSSTYINKKLVNVFSLSPTQVKVFHNNNDNNNNKKQQENNKPRNNLFPNEKFIQKGKI